MFCENCGQKLGANEQFCANCGTKVPSKKNPTVNQTNRNLLYLGVLVVVIVAACFLFKGDSEEIKAVKSWQNAFLEDANVTFEEVCNYAMKNVKWKVVTYEEKKAVRVSGVDRKTNEEIVAILNPYYEDDVMFLYYEEDGVEKNELEMGFYVTQYADEAAEALGRE